MIYIKMRAYRRLLKRPTQSPILQGVQNSIHHLALALQYRPKLIVGQDRWTPKCTH